MALRDVAGQERALEIIRGSIKMERIPHACLFKGEDGIGKKFSAINFAKVLNCQKTVTSYKLQVTSENSKIRNQTDCTLVTRHPSPVTYIDCCDKCPSCVKINKLFQPDSLITPQDEKEMGEKIFVSHPDVVLILPFKGEIRINVIRKLDEFLSYKPYEGKWKVVIVDEADSMNQSAANAFLKTLEEPPEQSVIILISSKPELIPLTIRSRCHAINFTPLPFDSMVELLKSNPSGQGGKGGMGGFSNKQAGLLCLLSGGRPGWALNKDLIPDRDKAFNGFKDLLSGAAEDGLWPDREAMEEWFDWAQLWLRDIAVFKAADRTDLLINRDKEEQIKELSQKAELKDILKLCNTFYNIKSSLRFNLNKQITLYYTYLLLKKTFRGTNA